MSVLHKLLIGLAASALMAILALCSLQHYRTTCYQLGYDAAVAAGKVAREKETVIAEKKESDLRAQLAAKDAYAFKEKQKHDQALEDAQRRVRTGIDSLHCPAAIPVPAGETPGNRPATGGLEVEPAGPTIVPETAADILGVAGHINGLVQRYERLEQRFDSCQALSEK